jgi:hypothetical protein
VRRLEDAEQIALLNWARLVTVGQETLFDWLVHCPNGGWRSPVEAARFQAIGVKPGIPDLMLPIRTTEYATGWLELKVGRNKPTEHQLSWHERLRSAGHYVQTYWHWHEAAADMLRYLERGPFTVVVRAKL